MGEGVGDVCVALPNDGEMNIEKSFRIESKRDHLWVADSTDTEPCAKKQAIEVCNDSEIETRVEKQDREVSNDTEMEPCANYQSKETLNATEMELSYNMEVKEAPIDIELEHSAKNQGKETSNDDILSEVSNPNLSPRENASSFQTISSRLVQLERNKHGGCGEITYDNSVNSSSEDTLSEEEQSRNTTTSEVSKSHVVLEIPKHASTTGIRKITFKFSKRKEDYVKQTPVDELPPAGFHEIPASHPSFDGVNAESSGKGFTESSDSLLCPSNTEPKMSKKVVPGYPTNVKKLLSTRILEGARVKYISASAQRELPGIIKGCGYVCGCSVCNFSKVLSAYKFELHAGGKTRHPNNHIYLENGKPIYNIINELKNAPLSALEEVIRNVAGSSVNDESLKIWKANMQWNEGLDTGEKNGVVNCPGMPHSAIGCSGQRVEDGFGLASCSCVPNVTFKTAEERKQMMKKSRSNSSSSIGAKKRVAEGGTKKRDNDLHRVLFLPNGLPDGTELAYYSKGKRILGGYKQGNGIVCSCCDTEISPSQFESHAGWAAKRQPYRHIYTSNGLTLHDIALLLANGQNLSISNSDDMCAICGDGGQLSFCDGCPRAFHAACLGVECVPTGGWHCSYCGDKSGPSRRAVGESRPIIIRLTRVVKAPEAEVGGCVVCRAQDFSVAKFDERTVILCDQCEKEYHVGCLRETGLCDLKELPKDKWFCCDDCNMIHTTLQNSVLNGADTIPASVSTSLVKKLAEKGSIDGSMNDIQWRIISGKNRRPEHKPLLTRATAIFRECFDPIVAKSGRDLIPVMVYGRNISGQEFGGIYCVVLIVKQVVVSAGLLRIFGREVAELPIVATSRENQGKGYFQALFSCIERLLFSMNVQRIVLPAAEDAESIWTNKLGFRKMSEEQLKKTRDFQLTVFKGTSMLEKEVCQVPDS